MLILEAVGFGNPTERVSEPTERVLSKVLKNENYNESKSILIKLLYIAILVMCNYHNR